MSDPQKPVANELSRSIGLTSLTLYGLGVTVGAGIYVLVGSVAGQAGLFAPLAFLLAAIAILPTAVSFTILVRRYPVSSGEARYAQEAFAIPSLTLVVGILVAIMGTVSGATVSVGSAGYIRDILNVPREVIIVTVLVGFGLLAIRGIAESIWMASLLTVVEVGGLLMILAYGFINQPEALATNISYQFTEFQPGTIIVILPAALLAFYAFIGFEDMVNVAEEVKSPETTFPTAILLVLVMTTLIYFLISALAVGLVPAESLRASESPLTDVAASVGISQTQVISGIGAIAALNGILIQVIMASRVIYGLARMEKLPAWFARVHPTRKTPVNAVVVVSVLMLALALTGSVEILAGLTSKVTLFVFIVVNLSLLKLHHDGKVRLSAKLLIAPVLGVLFSTALLLSNWILTV